MTFSAREQEGAHSSEITGIYGLISKVTKPDEGDGGIPKIYGFSVGMGGGG